MKYNLNKKVAIILALILGVVCLSSIIFLYYRQSKKTQLTQEVIADDVSMAADADNQRATLLGEINQQDLEFEGEISQKQLEFEESNSVVIEPEIERLDSDNESGELLQEQQITINSSTTVENFIVDEEVSNQKSTGAELGSSEISTEEELQWAQIWELRFMTPVKKDSFEIDFNSKTRLFEVNLKNKSAKDEFQNWLTVNNFSRIPPTLFLYIVAY